MIVVQHATVSCWPGPDSRSAAKSSRPRPICSGRYGGDNCHSGKRNIGIFLNTRIDPKEPVADLIALVSSSNCPAYRARDPYTDSEMEPVPSICRVQLYSRSAAFAAAPPEPIAPEKPPAPAYAEANHSPWIDVLGVVGGPDSGVRSGTLGANP